MSLIGPHQGCELTLMISCGKPAALISPPQDISDFIPFVHSGRFIWAQIRNAMRTEASEFCRSHVFTQPDQAWRIAKLGAIYADVRGHNQMASIHHREIGQLLGYTEEQISAFITAISAP